MVGNQGFKPRGGVFLLHRTLAKRSWNIQRLYRLAAAFGLIGNGSHEKGLEKEPFPFGLVKEVGILFGLVLEKRNQKNHCLSSIWSPYLNAHPFGTSQNAWTCAGCPYALPKKAPGKTDIQRTNAKRSDLSDSLAEHCLQAWPSKMSTRAPAKVSSRPKHLFPAKSATNLWAYDVHPVLAIITLRETFLSTNVPEPFCWVGEA